MDAAADPPQIAGRSTVARLMLREEGGNHGERKGIHVKVLSRVAGAYALGLASMVLLSCSIMQKGPHGGAVVTLGSGDTKAEVVANGESGEVMVMTWGLDLQGSKAIKATTMTIGSGDSTATLQSCPMETDPPDLSSRFYGQADWLRKGHGGRGWLRDGGEQSGGMQEVRHKFSLGTCWRAGNRQDAMWKEAGERRDELMGRAVGDLTRSQ